MRRLILAGAALALAMLVAGLAGLGLVRAWLDAPLGAAAEDYVLEVAPGTPLARLAADLGRAGVVAHPRLLSLYGRLTGAAPRIKAGEYLLAADQTPRGLVAMLVAGRVRLHQLTVVEGWTVRELLAALRAHPAVRTTLEATEPVALAAELGLGVGHAEGLFFPDTYRFARGTSDRALLRQAHRLMRERLAAAWADRAAGLPLAGPYEALILASVVERETALAAERPQVAGVFVRRLERGMRLQTDPTVIYGLGERFDGDLRRRDLTTDTPYNTYTRPGLPPTPIALPGEGALRAAVNPAPGDALYFVATGLPDGGHYFAATLEEHNAAVARYLARLREGGNGR